MIRSATEQDIPYIVGIGAAMAEELPHYRNFRYSARKVTEFAAHLIGSDDGFVQVAERDGMIVGLMAGMVTEHWMSEDRLGTELTVYMLPRYRGNGDAIRMIRAFTAWTRERGAVVTNLGICTDSPDVDRTVTLYERLGLRPYGFIFEA
jgi:GNAT superfamily N-acetyltransferase